jgi:hypothetical protein
MTLFDPINLSESHSLASIPAFFISVLILLIANTINNAVESDRNSKNFTKICDVVHDHHSDIYDTVKTHMNVISIGYPEIAISYIAANIKELREARNTSFTLKDESETANLQLYGTSTYANFLDAVVNFVNEGGIWRDIGDDSAACRFRTIFNKIANKNNYLYKFLLQEASQINFIILIYKNGRKEVLFNWDFKTTGQEPVVLLSREDQMVNMFSSHFEYLWRASSDDHDNVDTNSTSVKE